jgi:hypothetical protein
VDDAPSSGIRAPADPESARHVSMALTATPDRVLFTGTPSVQKGWVPGNPAGDDDLLVRIYDLSGDVIYETGIEDPLQVRAYSGLERRSRARPHAAATVLSADLAVLVPLTADVTHLVVARHDRVVSVFDLRPTLRTACMGDTHPACRSWLRASGRR